MAKQQVENGAQILDINMDEGMLDGPQASVFFFEPSISSARECPNNFFTTILLKTLFHLDLMFKKW